MARTPVDPRARFSPVAAEYERGRPGYPPELVDWILSETGLGPGAPAADVGCGTGIATRLLAERGLDVVGLDPSEEMLERARARGGARYRRGEAAATGLPPGSVALVCVAQALHWFDLETALPEFRRILRPGGALAAFWNERRASAFERAYDALVRRFSSEYESALRAEAVIAAARRWPGAAAAVLRRFECAQSLDWPAFRARVASSSYVAHGVADREGFERALRALFAAHERRGRVAFEYDTPALLLRFRP